MPTEQKEQDQEAPVQLTGKEAGEGQVRLSLQMEVDNFNQVAGGFEDDQKARAVVPEINTQAAGLVDLRAYADEDGRIKGMLYVHSAERNQTVVFNAPFRIYNDGKSIGYDGEVSDFGDNTTARQVFDQMVADDLEACYVTAIIGNDPGSLNFTNKGPHVIQSWDDKVKLPANFVMLTSKPTPLGWREDKGGKAREITVQNNGRLKLQMMGYLMMLRLHNEFPENVVRIKDTTNGGQNLPVYEGPGGARYTARRPDLKVTIDLSPTLSAAQQQQVVFAYGRFSSAPKVNTQEPNLGYVFDKTHFEPKFLQTGLYIYRYNLARWKGEITLPVGLPTPGALPAKGDMVVAMYFPQANDYGSVGFFAEDKLFYDGSSYARSTVQGNDYQVRYPYLEFSSNVLKKSKPTKMGEDKRYQKSLDNKVYYPVLKVTPFMQAPSFGMTGADFKRYKDWTAKATWTRAN